MKLFIQYILLISFLASNTIYGQKDDFFFIKLKDIGEKYVANLKAGNIENLKNANPPEGTWMYSKLLNYKDQLTDNSSLIYYGSYIEPSMVEDGIYAYNFFALQKSEESPYFFVAIVGIDTNEDAFKIDHVFLFTEREALKSWWSHTFNFYHSDLIKEVPDEFLYFICPPPPYKK